MLESGSLDTSAKRILWVLTAVFFLTLLMPPVRSYFFEMSKRWLYIFSFALSLSFVLTPIAMMLAVRFNVLDIPADRKIHETPTPLLGGLAIIVAFTSALIANMVLDKTMIIFLCSGIVIATMSLIDDWTGLSARLKLSVQVVVVLFLIYNGVILELFPGRTFWGYGLNVILTILWIVGITNALNFLDGMDGLAGGVSAIMAFFMGVVAFQTNQPLMGWIAIAVLGSCIGFLPFNFRIQKPAAVFLGDAGSTFLGFVLATLAVIGEWDENPIVSFSAPVLIFWVLIYDMAYITVERVLTGKVRTVREWIDYVGKDHIHHRMYALLGDRRKAVLLIYFLSATLGISAIALKNARPVDGILLVIQAFLITLCVSILEYSGRQRH
jgi:UDP-GlcNAc:undecaprenyl-phosphate GlcNAc-1-phosphate transferase